MAAQGYQPPSSGSRLSSTLPNMFARQRSCGVRELPSFCGWRSWRAGSPDGLQLTCQAVADRLIGPQSTTQEHNIGTPAESVAYHMPCGSGGESDCRRSRAVINALGYPQWRPRSSFGWPRYTRRVSLPVAFPAPPSLARRGAPQSAAPAPQTPTDPQSPQSASKQASPPRAPHASRPGSESG
jgi:hypothetical protein